MRLIFVRHGQTPSNVAHRLDTALPGPALTALGRAQAEALVASLAGEPVEAIWSSAAVRARQTAAPLATERGLSVVVREGLREVEAGDLEMRDDESAVRSYLGVVFAWAAGRTDVVMPGGEAGDAALSRVDAVVAELADSGAASAVIVSHGATIRLWTAARARGLDPAWVGARPLLNTGVVVVDGSPQAGFDGVSWAGAPLGASTGADGPAAEPAPGQVPSHPAQARPRAPSGSAP